MQRFAVHGGLAQVENITLNSKEDSVTLLAGGRTTDDFNHPSEMGECMMFDWIQVPPLGKVEKAR